VRRNVRGCLSRAEITRDGFCCAMARRELDVERRGKGWGEAGERGKESGRGGEDKEGGETRGERGGARGF
jgi:hypothetical protein